MPAKTPPPTYCPPKLRIGERLLLDSDQALALSETFGSLANDSRLRLLHVLIRAGELSVMNLAAVLGMSSPAVSSQLRVLYGRGILGVRRSGTTRYYRVVDSCVVQLMDLGLCLRNERHGMPPCVMGTGRRTDMKSGNQPEGIMKIYALKQELMGVAFQEALDRTRRALATHGFGIPVEMDTQAIFKQKLGKDSPSRVILGACLAPVAFEVLAQEPDIAVLLPCNVVVREIEGGCEVSAVSPTALFSLVDNVNPAHAETVEAKLKSVLQEVGQEIP